MNKVIIALSVALFAFLAQTSLAAHSAADERFRLLNMVGLASDARGNLYSADSVTGDVYVIPPDLRPIHLGNVDGAPAFVAVDRTRRVFVAAEDGRIHCIERDGRIRIVHRAAVRPVGLSVDRDGDLRLALEGGNIVTIDRSTFDGSTK